MHSLKSKKQNRNFHKPLSTSEGMILYWILQGNRLKSDQKFGRGDVAKKLVMSKSFAQQNRVR